jgi:hypothetical protein
VKTFKFLGSILTNKNCIHEDIKCRLEVVNSYYYSVQTPLSSRLLSKNLKIKMYITFILPIVLYGCETLSLILVLSEERRQRVFENRFLRRIFEPKGEENGEWRSLHIEELHSLFCSPNIVRVMYINRISQYSYRNLFNR